MHEAAYRWVAEQVARHGPWDNAVEIGSRDVNGSVRSLFGGARYTGVDIEQGPGVDVVADGSIWQPAEPVDCVVCCEVLEHHRDPETVVMNMVKMLRPGGCLIVTAAGPGRPPHSAYDGGQLRADEHYTNIDPDDLGLWLDGLTTCWQVAVNTEAGDVYAVALTGGK